MFFPGFMFLYNYGLFLTVATSELIFHELIADWYGTAYILILSVYTDFVAYVFALNQVAL